MSAFAGSNEEEPVFAMAELLSFVCEREAATIEPLVKGQQLIASFRTGEGKVKFLNSSRARSKTFVMATRIRLGDLCFALQHA